MTFNNERARRLLQHARAALNLPWLARVWGVLRRIPFLERLAVGLIARGDGQRPDQSVGTFPGHDLAPNEAFRTASDAAHQIEGMFSDFSMAIVDSLLSLQEQRGIWGNMMELGVYRGRSAALIGRRLRNDERLVLVDIADYLDANAISPFLDAVDFLVTSTENLRKVYAEYSRAKGRFRFVHIDASHGYRSTYAELQIADHLLARGGIIALDDFTNLNYSQNIAAIFKYLFSANTNLKLFLVTDEKAYLCRKSEWSIYGRLVLERLGAEMASRGVADFFLVRTDLDPEYRAFYARHRAPHETGSQYGAAIYEAFFRHP